jgi:hypothetical protein
MTQNGARAAGEDRGSGARDRVIAPRADAVDTPVHRDPRPGRQPARDQARADAELQQLPPSHMAVLAPRPLQDLGVEVPFEAISSTTDHYY